MARAGRPVVHDRFSRRRYRPPQASQIAWSGRANPPTPIASLPLLFVHGSAPGLVCQYTDKNGLGKGVELETMSSARTVTTISHCEIRAVSLAVVGKGVGWVERSETHRHSHRTRG